MAGSFDQVQEESGLVPPMDPLYVKFGAYNDISNIIESRIFYPIFITGLSGNGKTQMVEQCCSALKRELFRVNITIETDEDDLLGGFRLVQDTTKWFDGPVIRAMKSGGVLLLDEVDLASNKIMCLQPVLEGKGVFLKKINQFVRPAAGFNVIATANTKGQGNESGKFVGTNFLNEAFLERFPVTVEQQYPSEAIERKILKKVFAAAKVNPPDDFISTLVSWAATNRVSFANEVETEVITTRRLVHIVNAFLIFNDVKKSIAMCIARFDEVTKNSLLGLYDSLDASAPAKKAEKSKTTKDENSIENVIGT